MKHVFAATATLTAALTLTACSSDETPTADQSPAPTTATQERQQRPDTIYNPGDWVPNNQLNLTVDSVEDADSIPVRLKGSTEVTQQSAAPGEKFLLVHSRVETTDMSPTLRPCAAIKASVYTADMEETKAVNRDMPLGGDLQCPMTIAPGTGFGGEPITWVFEVPADFDHAGALFAFKPSACAGDCMLEPQFISLPM